MQAYLDAVLASQPFSFWPLDDDVGASSRRELVADRSAGVWGNVAFRVRDPWGGAGAAHFAGTGRIVDALAQTRAASAFTMECWYRAANVTQRMMMVQFNAAPWDQAPAVTQTPTLFVDWGLSNLWAYSFGGAEGYVVDQSESADGEWHHAAATFDGVDLLSLYRDGEFRGTTATAGNSWLGPGYWRMGDGDLGGPFTGDLACVAVYDRALSLGEIAAHFTAAPAARPSPPRRRRTTWTWVLARLDGEQLAELTAAHSRRLSFPLRGPATAQWSMDGRHWQANYVSELRTDLLVYRDGELLLRGRVGSSDDAIDASGHQLACAAVDYRGMLETRIIDAVIAYGALDTSEIAWDLVRRAQSGPDGIFPPPLPENDLDIRRGLAPDLGVRTGFVAPADITAMKAIDELSEGLVGGFEWWVDPFKLFRAQYNRGAPRPDFPLAYGTTVSKVKRQVDTTAYGNRMRVRGGRPEGAPQDQPGFVTDRRAPDLSQRAERRIDRVHSNQDLVTQAMTDASADYELSRAGNLVPSYTMTVRNDIDLWSPSACWVGDTVEFHVRSGRLDVTDTDKIELVDIALDDDGTETVDMTLGQIRSDLLAFFRSVPRRLERLERH